MPRLRVALLTEDVLQARVLGEMLQECLLLTPIATVSDLGRASKDGQVNALFCDWCFQSKGWKEVLDSVRERHPDLPVIVLSRTGGEKEWVEVLEAGAFDLLVPPYSQRLLLAVVEQAATSQEAKGQRAPGLQRAKAS